MMLGSFTGVEVLISFNNLNLRSFKDTTWKATLLLTLITVNWSQGFNEVINKLLKKRAYQ